MSTDGGVSPGSEPVQSTKSWDVLVDYLKTVISLASALLALTILLADKLLTGSPGMIARGSLVFSWIALVATVIAAVCAVALCVAFLRKGLRERAAILAANTAFFLFAAAALSLFVVGCLRITGVSAPNPESSLVIAIENLNSGPPVERGSTDVHVPDATNASIGSLGAVFIYCLSAVVAGALLWMRSTSPVAKGLGVLLIVSAPLISGIKLLNVEKLIAVDKFFGVDVRFDGADKGPRPVVQPIYSLAIPMPPFRSGSANVDEIHICATKLVANELAKTKEVLGVWVIGRSDKRELNPEARKKFASNWGLAQQRGLSIERILYPSLPTQLKIIVTNAGPAFTSSHESDRQLELDRSASIHVTGKGAIPTELERLSRVDWSVTCASRR